MRKVVAFMNGIEKITARITSDADQEIAQLNQQTRQQVAEILAQAETVVMDKTGTITEGKPAIMKVMSHCISENELLKIAAYEIFRLFYVKLFQFLLLSED